MESLLTPRPAELIDPAEKNVATGTLPLGSEISPSNQTIRQRLSQKAGQIAKAESVGTVFDVATMAAGVPLSVREATGSAIDYKIYGQAVPEQDEITRNPTRLRRIGKGVGTIALYAVTGIVAQRYGMEAAEAISDRFSDGVTGDYVTPLTTKLGAITGVNAAIGRFSR